MTTGDSSPFLSIVVPMRNESDWIDRCLETIFSQDYPADKIEVLVVDGMSDDGSYEMLESCWPNHPRLRGVGNPERIVASSLNLAIEEARGEIIVRVDSHTELDCDYVRVGVNLLLATGADNVGGPMVKLGGGPVGDAIAGAMSSRFGIGSYFQFADEDREVDTVYMGMWPRSVFDRVGLFDEELVRNQDDEFNYRIRKAGGRILVTPRMRSRYQNRQSWGKLAKQFFEYGLWKTRVLQKHPAQMSVRHFIPPAFDFAVISSLLAGVVMPEAACLGAAALILYALAMLAVAVREAPRKNRLRFWLALVIIHHGWALGFLLGMVRFAPRWLFAETPARKPRREFSPTTQGR
jgi:succinoglycan biosynthesis protein ExoA